MQKQKFLAAMTLAAVVSIPSGCVSPPSDGSSPGTLHATAAGALIGSKLDKTRKQAIIGSAPGAGTVIGNYMDRQAEELRQAADVVRVDDGIIVTMRDKILFDIGRARLQPGARASLKKLAAVMKKYDKTEIVIAGHTDSTGSVGFNQKLSDRRAGSVRLFLVRQGVRPGRLSAMGFGLNRPVASNSTPEGRAQNRRVELHISPDERLLQDAQKAAAR